MSYAPGERWDLDVLFPGGPTSPAFAAAIDDHTARLKGLVDELKRLPTLAESPAGWHQVLASWLQVNRSLGDLASLVYCYTSAHTDCATGQAMLGRIQDLQGVVAAGEVIADAVIGRATDAQLDALSTGTLASWRASFERVRRAYSLKLEPALEDLLAETDREGLHAWGQLYDTVVGSLTAEVEQDGVRHTRSVAQLMNARSSSDPAYRAAAFDAVDGAFLGIAEVCAASLTALTGSRQMRLDRVGAGPLADSVMSNRITQGVLDAMWEGTTAATPWLVRYFDCKAAMLREQGDRDTPKLRWCDLNAPQGVMPGGASLSWSDAQDLVVDAFAAFEPALATFARNLLAEAGVEAEDRPHKRPGGYCVGFDAAATSRIFLTFGGSTMDAVVLAHELGHAWHNHLLDSSPPGRRHITMSLAESASTYAESIVRDHIGMEAASPEARIAILDQELQAASGFLMNIRGRYDFELALYELRRQGPMRPELLDQTMVACLQRAYGGALQDYDSRFWANKLHFYISQFGFYNWPYTFGYLFSGTVYARAKAAGPSYRANVVDLLTRTGWQDSVPLARETLGVDLEDPAFWAEACAPIEKLVKEFEALSPDRPRAPPATDRPGAPSTAG